MFQYQITQRAEELLLESAAEQQALNRSVRALTRTSMAASATDSGASVVLESHMDAMKR